MQVLHLSLSAHLVWWCLLATSVPWIPETDGQSIDTRAPRRMKTISAEITPSPESANDHDSGVRAVLLPAAYGLLRFDARHFNPWGGKRGQDLLFAKQEEVTSPGDVLSMDKRQFAPWGGRKRSADQDTGTSEAAEPSEDGAESGDVASKENLQAPPFLQTKLMNSWDDRRNSFNSWGGKRDDFNSWGGKRGGFNSWGGKRTGFNSWGGKRNFNSWGGKRDSSPQSEISPLGGELQKGFGPWGGKRDFGTWGGKRAFNSWGGKRDFTTWGGKRKTDGMSQLDVSQKYQSANAIDSALEY